MSEQESDEGLMERFRDGDAAAFDELYKRHRPGLYRYFLRQTGSAPVAEELYQDVWMKLIRAKDRYEVRAKFTTYLYHMAHNRLIDYYRRKRPELANSFTDEEGEALWEQLPEDASQEPDQVAERRLKMDELKQAIEALPETQKEALLLREEAGMSLDEIAEATGVNRETAKSRLRYAVAKLRRTFEGLEDNNDTT